MVFSVAYISVHAASHAASIHHHGDLFYPFAMEVFGGASLGPDRFLRSSTALCVERQPYPPGLMVMAFLRQRVLVALQRVQAFTIQQRAETVGFRVSRHVTLLDPPLIFMADLYQALQS
ncbi:unnamed protein product [Calypogeia fissa]